MALYGISSPLITLGGLIFTDFAIPESVKSSGSYRFEIHKQPGGARQIDAMGNDPEPYQWSGCFLQPDAIDQMILLKNMKDAGNPVTLQYGGGSDTVNDIGVSILSGGGSFTDTVMIESVEFTYLAPMRIEYAIKCIPILNSDNYAPNFVYNAGAAAALGGATGIPAGP